MSTRLRVGMNLLWLRPGIVGGSETAAVATVGALDTYASAHIDLRLYAQTAFGCAHGDVTAAVTTSMFPVPGGSPGPRVVAESSWLPVELRRDRIDVVHCYGGVVPVGMGRPSVLTVHDVQPLEPGSVFSPLKKRWLHRMLPRSVAAAAVVAVPSGFVRDRLVELLGVDPDRVVVVPHGVDRARFAEPSAEETVSVLERFRLRGPYVLYPAITYPHKNHQVLLEAFANLAEPGPVLVLAGGAGEVEDEVDRLIERLGIGDRVRRVGRVTAREIPVLTRSAAVLAFPSRYEGFGLPVLEALGADTPVVAARAGALPAIVGDAGVLVDPDDVAGWTGALEAALAGSQADATWTARRQARLDRFEWSDSVALLVDAYRRAAAGGSRR